MRSAILPAAKGEGFPPGEQGIFSSKILACASVSESARIRQGDSRYLQVIRAHNYRHELLRRRGLRASIALFTAAYTLAAEPPRRVAVSHCLPSSSMKQFEVRIIIAPAVDALQAHRGVQVAKT